MLTLGQIANVEAIFSKLQIGTRGLTYVRVLVGTREKTVLDSDHPSNPRPSSRHHYLGRLPTPWPEAAFCHLILLSISKARDLFSG